MICAGWGYGRGNEGVGGTDRWRVGGGGGVKERRAAAEWLESKSLCAEC